MIIMPTSLSIPHTRNYNVRRARWYRRWRDQGYEIGRGEVKHKLNGGFFYNFCMLYKIGKFIKGKCQW